MGRGQSGHLKNDLDIDAWGRQKAVIDRSLFHGLFTFNVPVTTWYETINDSISSTITNCTSVDGALKVLSGATLADDTYLRTYKNPRYEPNRGMLYSTAMWFNDPDALMIRRFGQFTADSGVFFELVGFGDSSALFGVVRTTIGGVTTDTKYGIRQDIRGNEFDLSKGNVFDIQWQWRGVGNYVFFVNLKEVISTGYLGTLTRLSMYNPAIPLAFESINGGDNDPMYFGCVDVTSEGGGDNGKTYGSIGVDNDTGQIAITGYNQPVIAVRSKTHIGSLINTRDTVALLASAYSDQKSVFRIWTTRDFTAVTDGTQTWSDYGDGHLEEMVFDGDATFDTAKAELIFTCRVNIDETYATSALFEGRTEIWQTPGDMFVFTLHRETGQACNVGVTYEFAEEI